MVELGLSIVETQHTTAGGAAGRSVVSLHLVFNAAVRYPDMEPLMGIPHGAPCD